MSGSVSARRTKFFGGGILDVVGRFVGFLAGGDAHDADGVADHVGGALLSFRSGGIPNSPSG